MVPVADYDTHPAFAPFCRRTPESDGFLRLSELTDHVVEEFLLTGGRHKELIEKNLRRYDEAMLLDTKIDQRWHDPLRTAVCAAHNKLIEEKRARATVYPKEVSSQTIRTHVDCLYDHGYTSGEMPSDLIAQMQEVLRPDVEKLRRKAIESNGQIVLSDPTHPASYEILNDFCRRSGIFESLSAFYGTKYERTGFVLHYSSPRDTWFRVFDDVGLPLPKTAQMHFDESFTHPKAMLYLNDVEAENGAFSLIPRDAPWDNAEFELAYGKEIIKQINRIAQSEFDFQVGGNESGFRCPDIRELFSTLPHSMRRTSHAGDHILDGSDLSAALLSQEVFFEGRAGLMPIFVGSHTLHRGGIVTKGERVALQIVFFPPDGDAPVAPQIEAPPRPAPPKPFGRRLRDAVQILSGRGS